LTTEIHPGDLEPSRVDEHTYLTRRRRTYIDATILLGLMFALLTVLPARLILPGTTDIGRPALVICLLMFAWWVISRINPRQVLWEPNRRRPSRSTRPQSKGAAHRSRQVRPNAHGTRLATISSNIELVAASQFIAISPSNTRAWAQPGESGAPAKARI